MLLNKPSAGDTDWTSEINDNWTAIEGAIDQAICQGRLTISSGNTGSYEPLAKTPSATDQGADTVDFASAHGWVTGTVATPSATGGGLTAGTIYYLRAVDSDTVSFHNSAADAESGASKQNLTASITAEIRPFGKAGTTLYFTPYKGNRLGLYTGSTWVIRTFSEISFTLSALISGRNYDVFIYDNAGTPTLELLAWTDDTTRATALTTQDGIKVKSGAATRRYVGTIRTIATDATEDSRVKRFVINSYNRRPLSLAGIPETTDYWTYSSTWRQANANTNNKVQFLSNGEDAASLNVNGRGRPGASGSSANVGLGINSTTVNSAQTYHADLGTGSYDLAMLATYVGVIAEGLVTAYWLERQNGGSSNAVFIGDRSDLGAGWTVQTGIFGICQG